ncbi:MAG TPA: PAS domain-containing protein, partial [Pseudoduganella sp.]
MRSNLPVTSQEVLLEEGQTIVSTTDLQGNITYANPYFIRVSGFTEEELIGAPQNILRHPDMPAEAFADLWHTIRKGYPWTGMVKNRCKNGDFYWVLANITPVIENGTPVGYMSVRTCPSRDMVAQAATAYAAFKAGHAQGRRISRGEVVADGPLQRLLAGM